MSYQILTIDSVKQYIFNIPEIKEYLQDTDITITISYI